MHGHISHADFRAFLDHELAASQQAGVEQHVAGCPDCRVRLEAVRNNLLRLWSRN